MNTLALISKICQEDVERKVERERERAYEGRGRERESALMSRRMEAENHRSKMKTMHMTGKPFMETRRVVTRRRKRAFTVISCIGMCSTSTPSMEISVSPSLMVPVYIAGDLPSVNLIFDNASLLWSNNDLLSTTLSLSHV